MIDGFCDPLHIIEDQTTLKTTKSCSNNCLMNKQSELPTQSNSSMEELPEYPLYFRILLCFSMIGTLATGLQWPDVDLVRSIAILGLVCYLYASYSLQKRLKDDTNPPLSVIVGTLDSFIMGLCIGVLEVSLLPAALFWILLQFNAITSGGQQKWLRDNIAYFVGIGFILLVRTPDWSVSGHLEMGVAGLIGIAAYFCAYGVYTKKRLESLSYEYQKLAKEQTTHKLRSYQLSRYLPPPVWKAINRENSKPPPTQRKKLTVFFSDIKDFSVLAEELEAETLTDLLNNYLTEMSKIVEEHGGTIDKFMGDAIMVLFGDNDGKGAKADCRRCLSMSIAMRKRMKVLQQQWRNQGITRPLSIRMGINTGYCTVGTFGTRHHLDYTALGAHVNLASRLESAASPGEILITHESWSLIKDVVLCQDKGEITVKGFSHPIKVYQVIDLRKNLGKQQNYVEENAEGFSMYMDVDKLRNYDRERIIRTLESATTTLKSKDLISIKKEW